MPAIETKSVSIEVKAGPENIIEAYAATFNGVDSYGDTIRPGAFAKTIAERGPQGSKKIRVLQNHDFTQMPIGVPVAMTEDSYGLLTSTKMSQTQMGRDIYTLAQEGAINELSIGYTPVKFAYADEQTTGYMRELLECKLFEYSFLTLMPADERAIITSVKSMADLERLIAQAKAIAEVNLSSKAGRTLSGRNAKRVVTALKELQDLLAEAGVTAGDYQDGDRVVITGEPHMEGQSAGTVKLINPGPAYGIIFDGMEDMGVHRWYVDDELEPEGGVSDAEDEKAKKPRKKPMGNMPGMKSLPRAGAVPGTPGAANPASEPPAHSPLLSALQQEAKRLDTDARKGRLLMELRRFGASLGGN
ncbi:HK97 family phage prohead protease [Deinococcus sp. S9]|uniref:HK97 family phage prohead protease n=1 Tax=Deinococcus sp. S9 TaxID=2545754 RepID=UPI00105575E7|nr:HK97 family phage prohead protease [Deinococcus sp. S9]TDE85303.1 HK97 family phage prohead protease [Deinococcus sp. S9]